MLYISEAEATARKLMSAEVDLARVVRDACELFHPVAEDQGVNLTADVASNAKV